MAKIAINQINSVVGNPILNAVRMISFMETAKEKGATVALFGELSLTGYCAGDQYLNSDYIQQTEKAWSMLTYAADKLGVMVGVGRPQTNKTQENGEKHLFNSFYTYKPKSSLIIQSKVCLPTYSEFDENRWFEPASINQVKPMEIDNQRIGFVICEDGWNNRFGVRNHKDRFYKNDPIDHLLTNFEKVDVLINISASPDYIGKQNLRIEINKRIAKEYETPVIFINVVGSQDELVFGGRSFILNKNGDVIHQMAAFKEDQFILDIGEINNSVIGNNFLLSDMAELDGMIGLYLSDYFQKSGISKIRDPRLKVSKNSYKYPIKIEEIIAPFSPNKTKAGKTMVGLSGGKDSTAVAVMLKRHLGAENVLGVMMPYKLGIYTHQDSKSLAEELGSKLGIEVREETISETVDLLFSQLNIETDTLSHQNMQARIRATILWSIANKEGRVVINTTNFSEAACGYGTIGGDLLGLPLIASLPATTIIQYLTWLKENGELAITEEMIHRPPTAELTPGQLDSDELGDYYYIDPILESLRMNFGDLEKVKTQFSAKNKENVIYNGSDIKWTHFLEKLEFLATKLLKNTEFKRWYYHKTPQFTPFSWLRWKWPIANNYMDTRPKKKPSS